VNEIHQIVPAAPKALWFFAAIFLLLFSMAALFGWFAWSSLRTTFALTDNELRIRSALYGRSIPYDRLDAGTASIIDLGTQPEYRLTARTNGIGMPGYGAGWFQRRGGGKVLAFVTSTRQVVHVPTRDGYELYLSVREAERFLTSLQQRPDSP
jgi:hypothetical protein